MNGIFKGKVDPEVQKQIDILRQAVGDLAQMLKEYEAKNLETIKSMAECIQAVADEVARLGEERARRHGAIVSENRWKQ